MENKNVDLKSVSTRELVEELKKREGVKSVEVAPYDKYSVFAKDYCGCSTGPAIIQIITD